VIIELAPAMAPHTVANIEALVRLKYFDGLAVLRVQDNFVAQWGDPDETRKIPDDMQKLRRNSRYRWTALVHETPRSGRLRPAGGLHQRIPGRA